MRISDWSSDVCSSDLGIEELVGDEQQRRLRDLSDVVEPVGGEVVAERRALALAQRRADLHHQDLKGVVEARHLARSRSEEHTSELQSLMRISYAVFCLKKKKKRKQKKTKKRTS